MIQPSLQKNLLISLACHAACFLAFSFSFGGKLPVLKYSPVSFRGQILNLYDFARPVSPLAGMREGKSIFPGNIRSLWADTKPSFMPGLPVIKPPSVSLLAVKQDLTPAIAALQLPRRGEPVITFHPLLPQHFTLYFKDRQTAHIEVMFNIVSTGQDVNPVMLQRKISSGNLEVDLLSMRYIGHYLFIQKKRFVPDKWQTVKIDLSP